MNKELSGGSVPQFGVKIDGEYKERPAAYAVVFNEVGEILVLQVSGKYHLPGGGIDPGESSEQAVVREAMEEAGCEFSDLIYLCRANHFFQKSISGPINNIAVFFTAKLTICDPKKSSEPSHLVFWVKPEEFISGNANEFQRWAVQKALEKTAR